MAEEKLLVVVESEPDRRRSLAACLRRAGFEVLETESGEQALEALGEREPAALVLDWDFHRDDGRDLLADMRRQPRFRHLPALAVTASESGREAGEVFVRGVELLPGRPLRLGLMAQILAQAVAFLTAPPRLSSGPAEPAREAGEPPAPPAERMPAVLPPAGGQSGAAMTCGPLSVLLIDDEIDHLRALRLWLIRSGYLVETARDGQEGLDRLARHRPDVVVLDLGMPRMNGQDFLKRLRASADLARLPVVVLSGQEWPVDPPAELQGTVHLQKPAALEDLVRAINQATRSSRPRPAPPAGGPPGRPPRP